MIIRKIFLNGLKVLPIIACFILSSFIVLHKWNAGNNTFINNITGTSITTSFIIYTASHELGFCAMHKTFIIYDTITSIWIDVRSVISLKIVCCITNWLLVVFAIGLFLWLIKFIKKKAGP